MNFRSFDLNLLRVLDAMLKARNTTRVGEQIGLSQPAVSAALGRLRELLHDPLFVREGNRLIPTAFALSLQEPVRSALESLEHALSGGGSFDPAQCDRSFVIGASDYFNEMLIPALTNTVADAAPSVRLKVLPVATANLPATLTAEHFGMVLSISVDVPDWIERRLAFHASDAVSIRAGHPLLKEARLKRGDILPLEFFCTLPHAIFSVTDKFQHFEDLALARIGRTRQVRVSVPSYYGVARIVAQSDLLGVLPTRFACSIAKKLNLEIFRLPFEMPLIGLYLYWRKRDASNREHAWLRGLILDLLAPLDEIEFPVADSEFALDSC